KKTGAHLDAPLWKKDRAASMRSFLHRTQHDSLDKIPLQEGINEQNRQGGEQDRRHLHRFGRRRIFDHLLSAPERRIRFIDDDDLPKNHLQGPLGGIVDVQNRRKIVVPMDHGVKQADGGQGRFGQGQDDPPENLQVVRPVDDGRFVQLLRYVEEELAHDDQIEGIDGRRENQGPQAVDQPRRPDPHVGGDHPRAEQQGEYHHEQERLLSGHRPGQAVSHGGGEGHVDKGSDHGDEHRDKKGPDELLGGKDVPVGVGHPFLGPEQQFVLKHLLQAGKGYGENVDKGKQHRQRDQQQHKG